MTSQAAAPSFVRRSRLMLACVALIATLAAVVEVPQGAVARQAHATASSA